MAQRNSQIVARLNLNGQQYNLALSDAEARLRGFANRARGISGINLGGGPGGLVASLGSLKSMVAAGGVGLATKALFGADKTVEGMVRSLASVTDGTESVTNQMKELRKVAELPGINLEGAVEGSAVLQSLGKSAKESREYLTQWSNAVASAGGSAEDFKGVMIAVRQILSKPMVQQDDINQILDRVPLFSGINARLADKKNDSAEWMKAAIAELQKLPRVARGAQEAIDGLSDAWDAWLAKQSAGVVGAVATGGMNALANILSGKKSFGDAFKEAGADISAIETDPVKRFDLTKGEAEKRQQEKRAEAALKEINRRKVINESIREDFASDRLAFDLGMAKARQDQEEVDRLQSALELHNQIKEAKKEGWKVDQDQIRALEKQSQLRREDARQIRQAAFAAETALKHRDLAVEEQRRLGRDRKADRMEDEAKVADLVRAGADPKAAKEQVERERNLVEDERLGPRRRRLRRRQRFGPETPIPERADNLVPGDIPGFVRPGADGPVARRIEDGTNRRRRSREYEGIDEFNDRRNSKLQPRNGGGKAAPANEPAAPTDKGFPALIELTKQLIDVVREQTKTPADRAKPARGG